jgi:SSS family solute:Na+ symporter
MATIDWVVIAAYFLGLLGLAWWVILKGKDTAEDYFLSGRSLGWLVVGASIFASNIGSEHLVGLAGSRATSGVAMAHYELHAWCLLVLGWVMVPFYMRSRVYTMPEFLERRFSATARWVLSIISLVAYVLTKIAVGIFAGGVVSGTLIPEMRLSLAGVELDSFWIGSLAVVLLTGLYTVLGGSGRSPTPRRCRRAILVLGSAVLTFFGLQAIGGWGEFRAALPADMFNLWKPHVPAGMEGSWAPVKEAGSLLWIVNNIYFQYYSVLIFVVSAAAMVIVSHLTLPPPEEKLKNLTFATMTEEHRRESRASWGRSEVVWSCVTLALILAAYLYFNG